MKITAIKTYRVRIPLKPERRMISALGKHDVSHYLVLRIETDTGIEGAGEATVLCRWSGETAWGAQAIVDRVFTPQLIGQDPCDIANINQILDRTSQGNWFTKSAIEMACWDIKGKEAALPVYELLGGAVRSRSIKCRFSMGAYSLERAERRTQELVSAGFTTIKVKVGTNPDEDVARVKMVRETMGPDLELTIDANAGWDAATAIAAMKRMSDFNVALFEQPTPRGDFAALAEVRQAIAPEIMADDICFDLADAKECIRNNACDVINVYPGKNGGISKTAAIVSYAAEHGIPCSIGSNLELDIASAAMCHAVVGCPNMNIEQYPGDILGPEYHEICIVKNPLKIEGPVITIPDSPGLGIEVDWGLVEAHAAD